jgi:hypothetical protein
MKPKIDFRSTRGIMLRGKNVYGAGGGTAPNPNGKNQWATRAAAARLARKKQQNG